MKRAALPQAERDMGTAVPEQVEWEVARPTFRS
jgi:hypothetical protein